MQLFMLKGKRISLWGLGREGLATLHFLRAKLGNIPLTIITDAPLQDDKIPNDDNLVFASGADIPTALQTTDIVIKSPGISRYRPELIAFRQNGGEVTTPTNIWLAQPRNAPAIAVTGSNGKSTTVCLLHHILNNVGFPAQLAGNIGTPLLELDPLTDCRAWIIELSSYQTADLYSTSGPPLLDIALVLNLFPEHLQWHQSHEQYYRDKLNILISPTTQAILNAADPRIRERHAPHRPNTIWFNDHAGYHVAQDWLYHKQKPILKKNDWPLKGIHNLVNLAAALTLCQTLGLNEHDCLQAALCFPGLPHRLEYLGQIGQHQIVNDSNSKTPEATLAALDSFPGETLTLIAGGEDRGQDFNTLATYIVEHPLHAVITAYETGPRLHTALKDAISKKGTHITSPKLLQAKDLTEATQIAQNITPEGGLILLSPAAPSYDGFKSFEDRGNQFKQFITTA